MHPFIHSLSRSNRGTKSGDGRARRRGGGGGEKERISKDTGLESVPVGIVRIERSQERARDPRQKTINTDFANSYTPPERHAVLAWFAHTSFAFRRDRWRQQMKPSSLLARVRRLLHARAPI